MSSLLAPLAIAGVFILYLVVRAVGGLIGKEAVGWAPHVARGLALRAAERLPAVHRDRYAEEWSAELEALSDRPITALLHAIGILGSARRLNRQLLPLPQVESSESGSEAPFKSGIRRPEAWVSLIGLVLAKAFRLARWLDKSTYARKGFAGVGLAGAAITIGVALGLGLTVRILVILAGLALTLALDRWLTRA